MAHRLVIERALTAYYLGTDSGNGAGPVRFIDASRATLEAALGEIAQGDPVAALAQACDGPDTTAQVLALGWSARWPDPLSPGYLRFLVLTCAVVSIADDSASREFGLNLAALLGCDNIFQDRTALPKLWAQLADWCRAQRADGAAIREFLLPSSERVTSSRPRLGNVRYLRLTYEIAFPTWRDLSHLRVVLVRRHDVATLCSDPFEAARVLCPLIERDLGFSEPMRLASAEFRKLYDAKATLLHLHRFWGALSHVLTRGQPSSVPETSPLMVIRLGVGVEDAEATVCLRTDGNGADDYLDEKALDGPAAVVIEGASTWLNKRASSRGSSLVKALDGGAVLLFETSFARWESSDDIASHAGRCLLLRRELRKDLAGVGRLLGRLSEHWSLYGPIDGMAKASLLSKLAATNCASPGLQSGLRVYGGIRVGTAFLGRTDFLPKISFSGNGKVSLTRVQDDSEVEVRLTQAVERELNLEATDTVTGVVVVTLEEAPVKGIDPLVSERKLVFVPDAAEHARLHPIDTARWAFVQELSVVPGNEIRVTAESSEPAATDAPTTVRMRDLGEALYARGAGGWTEADLVAILAKMTGADGPSVWDVLRALQEVGWLRAAIATTWRVRRWWLRRPELATVGTKDGVRVVFVGSAPEVLRRRFIATVREAGGSVLSMSGPSDYCLGSLAAEGVDVGLLVDELRWANANLPGKAHVRAPSCWPPTNQEPSRHDPVSVWSMTLGRFEASATNERSSVELVRHRRRAGDRPDLYTVRGGEPTEMPWVSLSRTAAVLEAYRRAVLPMFEVRGPWLVRLTSDGYLPLPLVEAAVLRTGRVPGPYLDGQRWTYAYPVDNVLLHDIRFLLGEAIVRDVSRAWVESYATRRSARAEGRARARSGSRASGVRLRV